MTQPVGDILVMLIVMLFRIFLCISTDLIQRQRSLAPHKLRRDSRTSQQTTSAGPPYYAPRHFVQSPPPVSITWSFVLTGIAVAAGQSPRHWPPRASAAQWPLRRASPVKTIYGPSRCSPERSADPRHRHAANLGYLWYQGSQDRHRGRRAALIASGRVYA